MAAAGKLIWTGVACCVVALIVNLFPRAAFDLGADPGRVRVLFGFGVFLIIAALFAGGRGEGRRGKCPHEREH